MILHFHGTACLAVAACAASLAAAQPASRTNDCLDSLPPNVFTRVPVVLEATVDSQAKMIHPTADLLTQETAVRLRSVVESGGAGLPMGDSAITWRKLGSYARVTVHRDGQFTWTEGREPDQPYLQSGDTLLPRALAALRADGELVFLPDDIEADSITFSMNYRWPQPRKSGGVDSLRVRMAFPLFSLDVPWEKPAVDLMKRRPRYPELARMALAEGHVRLQFVVDAAGRADRATIRELHHPRTLDRQLEAYYSAFLVAAIAYVGDAEFEPAEVGGCKVRQLVQLPVSFMLSGVTRPP